MPPVASRNCRLAANSAAITMSVISTALYSSRTKGSAAMASTMIPATSAARRVGATTSARCSGSGVVTATGGGLPSRPCGFNASTMAMIDELDDERELGERERHAKHVDVAQRDTKGLGHADQRRGEKCARNRPQAADHGDDKGVRDDRQIHAKIGGFARKLQRAGQSRQECAEREDRGKETRLVDAQRRGERAILRSRADQHAEARARHQQRQRDQDHRCRDDQEQVVLRNGMAGDFRRSRQSRSARTEQVFGAPQRTAPRRG